MNCFISVTVEIGSSLSIITNLLYPHIIINLQNSLTVFPLNNKTNNYVSQWEQVLILLELSREKDLRFKELLTKIKQWNKTKHKYNQTIYLTFYYYKCTAKRLLHINTDGTCNIVKTMCRLIIFRNWTSLWSLTNAYVIEPAF